ncbi:MAG TPA: hypothetical protein VMB50_10610 [Myxococcales bacterium]|nr:hypothetical protein [Myxococcales bacterium]
MPLRALLPTVNARGLATSTALALIATLLAACPTDPVIDPEGVPCSGQDCPANYACVSGSCQLTGSTGGLSGGTGGGPAVCSLPDGGSRPAGTFTELLPCVRDADCVCGESCVEDLAYAAVYYGSRACELPCAVTEGCDNYKTYCSAAGFCALAVCGRVADGGWPTNGAPLYGACTLQTPGDGTCVPQGVVGDAGALFGECLEAGEADGGGTCGGSERGQEPIICGAGLVCAGSRPGDGGSYCEKLCNPDGGSCPAGQVCRPGVSTVIYVCGSSG